MEKMRLATERALDIVGLMANSQSQYARELARSRRWLVEKFLEHVSVKPELITAIARGEESKAEDAAMLVFPYGWLSPDGQFFVTGIRRHEDTVQEITGFPTSDAACSAQARWIKMSAGLPVYTHRGEIYSADASWGIRRITNKQIAWLDRWMIQISDGSRTLHFFNG